MKGIQEEGKDENANASSSLLCFWRILIDLYSNDSEMSSCTRKLRRVSIGGHIVDLARSRPWLNR